MRERGEDCGVQRRPAGKNKVQEGQVDQIGALAKRVEARRGKGGCKIIILKNGMEIFT